MARHLTEIDGVSALRRGKQIEQFLGFGVVDGRRTIRWLTISARRNGSFVVNVHHVFDEGSDDIADVSEFPPVDEDEYVGEGREHARAHDPEEALRAAASEPGADSRRWVNQAVIGDEHLDHR